MKNLSVSVVILAMVIGGLSACGGSATKDSVSTSATSATTPTIITQSATNQPTNNQPSAPTNTAIRGNQMALSQTSVAGTNKAIVGAKDTATVMVDGRAISFDLPGFFVGKSYQVHSLNFNGRQVVRVGSGQNLLNHSRFGYLKEGANGTPTLFSQGVVTTNMPTTGSATYQGHAAHVSAGNARMTEANFKVDYGAKTVLGTIVGVGVDLAGTIQGNQFSGSKNGVTTHGYFYGNHAAELGGTYKNENGSVSGAYGATK